VPAEHFRRIDPRYERQIPIEIVVEGKRLNGRSRNLSLGGMYLDALEPLAMGAAVHLRFQLPTQPEPVEVAGDVRWIVQKPGVREIGMGVRFQGLRARDVWALNRFFQTAP